MPHGIGADLVEVCRVEASLARMGQGFAWRILAESERPEFLCKRARALSRQAIRRQGGVWQGAGMRRSRAGHAARDRRQPRCAWAPNSPISRHSRTICAVQR